MLKKFAVVLSAIIVMFSMQSFRASPLFASYLEENINYEVYLQNYSSSADIVQLNDINTYKTLSNIHGESCRVRKDITKEDIFSDFNAKIVLVENHEGGTSYYAYARSIKYKTEVKGKTVNLHVFVGDRGIKVGSPIIFGSF